jgi:hypothetical protein
MVRAFLWILTDFACAPKVCERVLVPAVQHGRPNRVLGTLYEAYPNDREVYYPWTPAATVNEATGQPYGDAIVGSGYQVLHKDVIQTTRAVSLLVPRLALHLFALLTSTTFRVFCVL